MDKQKFLDSIYEMSNEELKTYLFYIEAELSVREHTVECLNSIRSRTSDINISEINLRTASDNVPTPQNSPK